MKTAVAWLKVAILILVLGLGINLAILNQEMISLDLWLLAPIRMPAYIVYYGMFTFGALVSALLFSVLGFGWWLELRRLRKSQPIASKKEDVKIES